MTSLPADHQNSPPATYKKRRAWSDRNNGLAINRQVRLAVTGGSIVGGFTLIPSPTSSTPMFTGLFRFMYRTCAHTGDDDCTGRLLIRVSNPKYPSFLTEFPLGARDLLKLLQVRRTVTDRHARPL